MNRIFVCSVLVSALSAAAGCYVAAEPQYTAEEDGAGDLVEVSPGVEVVADYDEPVFFADDFYWAFRGGVWYSSPWYRGGWVRAEHVPDHIGHIEHPEMYRHYRPAGYVAHAQVHGGYASHAQFHAAHPVTGTVRVRAAVHGGRHR